MNGDAAPATSAPAPAPAPATAAAAHPPPSHPPSGQPPTQPVRPFLPGAPMSSAEKSLFPGSMPGHRQLPSIHTVGTSAAPLPAAASPGHASAPRSAGSPPYSAGLTPGSRPGGLQQPGASLAPPYATHRASKSPSAAPAPYSAGGATPTPPIIPPLKSPATSPKQAAAVPAPPAQRSQQSPPPAPSAQYSANAASPRAQARGNPMSVSAMLSGPSRERPVAAYSPTPGSSAGQTPGTTPGPVVSSAPTANAVSTGNNPQPPVMPTSRPSLVSKPSSAAGAPAAAPAATSAAWTPSERSSYPPLPSAYARESPYAPGPGGPATPGANTPKGQQPQQQQQQQQSQGQSTFSTSVWGSASAALAHAQAQQQQAKDSLFPATSPAPVAGEPSAVSHRLGPAQPPQQPQQQQPAGGRTNGHQGPSGGPPSGTGPGRTSPGAASGGASFAWQAQAAQQAQQVQREREQEHQSQQQQQQAGPGKPPSGSATTSQPSQSSQPRSSADAGRYAQQHESYAGGVQPPAAQAAVPANADAGASAGHKRRRSDLGSAGGAPMGASTGPGPTAAPPAPPAAEPAAPPPPPAAPAPPLFTYTDQRRACVRPPMVEVVNEAVDAWERRYRAQDGDGAGGESERKRPFLGRVVYDALVPPAKLLDGEVLAQGLGGYVEVLVPTSWIVGPAAVAQRSGVPGSSCSVAPVDLPPVAFTVGPPTSYDGAPVPETSPSTPLVLPAHLADLPGFRKRQVWGTDVYTDDSDILALLVHSGWLRVTRRERRRRAGEKGAGADAIRRARVEGEERIEAAGAGGESGSILTAATAMAIKVTLGVVPPLVRYQGIERQGVRSRNWGNGHDGVSLRVENAELVQKLPPRHAPSSRKAVAAQYAQQLATWDDDLLAADLASHRVEALQKHEALVGLRPPKRFRLERGSASASGSEDATETVVVSDTFVLPLGEGEGRFVDADAGPLEGSEGQDPADAMDIE
ncbi:hypothetical protein JCM8202_004160 [Rhodotorula sphaerocarpa]